jgi:hypothetical protein
MKVRAVGTPRGIHLAATVALALVLVGAAHADTFVVGTPGTGLAASADFSYLPGGDLQIVVANLGEQPTKNPDALGAMFFSLPSDVTLTPLSATVTSGSHVYNYPSLPANIGGEWSYKTGFDYNGTNVGVSAVGYGLGSDSLFPGGTNLSGPTHVDGQDWSIISMDPPSGLPPGQFKGPLVANSATFVFDPSRQFAFSEITNLGFQYGTSLDEPWKPIPEPTTIVMVALGLGCLGGLAKRRRSR